MRSDDLQYSPVLTQIGVEYENNQMIAEQAIPVLPVDAKTFQWVKFAASAAFDLYNAAVDEDSEVPQVKRKGEMVPGAVADYGLRTSVSAQTEQASQQVGFSELAQATKGLFGDLALGGESRFAEALVDDNNFLASRILTAGAGLSPAKWDQTTATPLRDCKRMIDLLPKIPGGRRIGVFSKLAWDCLAWHASSLDAVKYTMIGGVVQYGPVAQILGLDAIYVEEVFVNAGAPNVSESAMSLGYLMGDDVAFLVEPGVGAGGSKYQPAWAYIFRKRMNGQLLPVYTYPGPNIGGHGSTWVQVARDEALIVTGKLYGSRIKDTTTP